MKFTFKNILGLLLVTSLFATKSLAAAAEVGGLSDLAVQNPSFHDNPSDWQTTFLPCDASLVSGDFPNRPDNSAVYALRFPHTVSISPITSAYLADVGLFQFSFLWPISWGNGWTNIWFFQKIDGELGTAVLAGRAIPNAGVAFGSSSIARRVSSPISGAFLLLPQASGTHGGPMCVGVQQTARSFDPHLPYFAVLSNGTRTGNGIQTHSADLMVQPTGANASAEKSQCGAIANRNEGSLPNIFALLFFGILSLLLLRKLIKPARQKI